MKYIIIGSGPAGVFAAQKIRKTDIDSDILILTEEKYPLYARPRLPEFIAGDIDLDTLVVFKEQWYEKNKIIIKINSKVSDIDINSNEVILENGEKEDYDKLLFATGSKPFCPPFNIKDDSCVYMLRTIDDALKIKEIASASNSVTVIGGGLLGLEAANGLRQLGLDITVIEYFDRLLPRQLDNEGAELLKAKVEGMGIKLELGANINEINKGFVGIEGKDGIKSDFILISTGIRSEVELAKKCGLEVNRGIVINNKLQTSIKGIYAAGDCAQFNNIVYGIWPPSKEQGELAGLSMGNQEVDYQGSAFSATIKVAGIDIASLGSLQDVEKTDNIKTFKILKENKYLKIYTKDGVILCSVFVGDVSKVNKIKELMETKQDISGKEEELINQ